MQMWPLRDHTKPILPQIMPGIKPNLHRYDSQISKFGVLFGASPPSSYKKRNPSTQRIIPYHQRDILDKVKSIHTQPYSNSPHPVHIPTYQNLSSQQLIERKLAQLRHKKQQQSRRHSPLR